MKFCSGGEKMRIVSGQRGENERQRHFLHKTCNQEVSGSSTLQSDKTKAKKCTKKVCCTCKVAFLLIRTYSCFFFLRFRCHRHLALHDFIFCLRKL